MGVGYGAIALMGGLIKPESRSDYLININNNGS